MENTKSEHRAVRSFPTNNPRRGCPTEQLLPRPAPPPAGRAPSTGTQTSADKRPLQRFQVSDVHGLCQSSPRLLVTVPVLNVLPRLDIYKKAKGSLLIWVVTIFKLNRCSSSDCPTSITSGCT